MKPQSLLFPLLTSALLCTACGGSDDASDVSLMPTFNEAACPAVAAQAVVKFTCGTVDVPENRANPKSRRLTLSVAIARTSAAGKAADPIMFLAGGPGPIVEQQFAIFSQPGSEALLGRRDIVFFDYRGLGRSTPPLACKPGADGGVDAAACVQGLVNSGADLAGYTDAAIAADAHDIRVALKLGAVNVWGVSYGTLIALLMERAQPQGVRSMILDSTYAPQIKDDAVHVGDSAQVVRQLAADCTADVACAGAYPNLMARFEAALPGLNANPLTADGQPWTGDALLALVASSSTSRTTVPFVPLFMDQIAQRSLTTVAGLFGIDPPPDGAADADLGPLVLSKLTRCGADVFTADEPGLLALAQGSDNVQAGFARNMLVSRHDCAPWPAKAAAAADKLGVVSAKPTLMFSGAFDSLTTLALAQRVKSTLSNAKLLVFPGWGHAVLEDRDPSDTCVPDLAHAFLDTLNGAALDLSCVNATQPPQWVVNKGAR